MERSQPYVYLLSDKGIPFYVGMGVGSRAYHHVREGNRIKERETFKTHKINKILREGRDIEYQFILCDTRDEAAQTEIDLISQYGRRGIDSDGILTNRAEGGTGGLVMTPEQIQAHANARRGYWEKLSSKRQQEILDKIKRTKLEAGSWRKTTDWMRSSKNKDRMQQFNESRKHKINQLNENGNVIQTFPSTRAAALALNISQGSISNAVNGRQPRAGGFRWKRI